MIMIQRQGRIQGMTKGRLFKGCDLDKSQLKPEIRLHKRCKTSNLSRVSSRAKVPVLRRDSDSLSSIVCVTEFQV